MSTVYDFLEALRGAWAIYACDVFGNDTEGKYVWERRQSARDLTLGDGSTASTMPTFVDYPDHDTAFYTFDGVDDYFSGWPTMPAAYTVCAALSASYPDEQPYFQSCNDTTIQTLLTTPGSFAGNLHALIIFDRELTADELVFAEEQMMRRLWDRTSVDPYNARLIREDDAVAIIRGENPKQAVLEYVGDANAADDEVEWDEGLVFSASSASLTVPDDAALRLSAVTLFISGDFEYDTGSADYKNWVSKGANYSLWHRMVAGVGSIDFTGVSYGAFDFTGVYSLAVTCVDGGTPALFVNGLYHSDFPSTATLDDTDTSDLISGYDGTADAPLGTLHHVAVYNRVLTAPEIKMLHLAAMLARAGLDSAERAVIVDIDGDDQITESQTNVVVACRNAGSTAGKLYLTDGPIFSASSVIVEQAIDSWSDTSIQFDVTLGAL